MGPFRYVPEMGVRWRIAEQTPPGATNVKRAGHNRIVYDMPDGSRRYRLHMTDVVTREADGSYTLDDGGYRTITTRRAMVQGLRLLSGRRDFAIWSGKPKFDHILARHADTDHGHTEVGFDSTLNFRF